MDLTEWEDVIQLNGSNEESPLTGLCPKVAFQKLVELKGGDLNGKAYLIYLQLDQLTEIWDVLGCDYVEELLGITGERLQGEIKKIGVATQNEDGSFSLFLIDKLIEKPIHNYMKEIKSLLETTITVFDQELFVTCSYGLSVYPDHGITVQDCLEKARIALNQENKLVIRDVKAEYNYELVEKLREDFYTEMSLRKGLEENQFELYYQPQIDSTSGNLIGLEGLIRWHHPDEGMKLPGTFIELAESTGLIFLLGEWVVEQAFNKLTIWKKQGETSLTLSINISSRHFLDETFQKYIEDCLGKFDINPKQLIIEITEDVALEDLEVAKSRIQVLRTWGIQVSIDDFGTGFSAFHYLQHFPVHEIKVDRQFIQDITDNEISMKIAKTIIDLANTLGLKVVCEGVETKKQCEILRKIGCHILQGYYFSKPMRYQEVWDWCREKKKAYPSID